MQGGTTGKAMKRRGILAAATAVVAGIAAQRAAQSVAATSGTGTDGNLVLGSNSTNNTANYTSSRTQVISGLNFRGPVLLDCSASPFQSTGDANAIGISGISRGTAAGVYGADYSAYPSGYPAGMNAGVYGYTYAQGHSGVRGDGGSNGIGVSGVSTNSNAILGTTLGSPYNANPAVLGLGYGIGVQGQIPSGGMVANTNAVIGVNQSTGANGSGVAGRSATGYGVVGYTSGGSASMSGISDHTNIPAFAGGNSAPGGLAASFSGTVYVNGSFVVQDPANKHGAIKHPDGSTRLLYSMESPESWLEDFGTGQLANGKAEVKLDADFAAVVHSEQYMVFLTDAGALGHLAVGAQTPAGFTVTADKAGMSGRFYWRVVAKPKTDKKAERLAKFVPPEVRLPTIADLPTPAPPLDKKP